MKRVAVRPEIEQRIQIDPNVHFGKPCVADTRIPMIEVLEIVGEGLSFEQITRDCYPDLELEDVRACSIVQSLR